MVCVCLRFLVFFNSSGTNTDVFCPDWASELIIAAVVEPFVGFRFLYRVCKMVIVLVLGRHHILCCCSGLGFAESSPLQQNSKRLCSSCQGDDAILVKECPSIRVKKYCSWPGTLDHLMCVDVHPSISSRLHLMPAVSSSKVCLSVVRVCVCEWSGSFGLVAQGGEGCTMCGAGKGTGTSTCTHTFQHAIYSWQSWSTGELSSSHNAAPMREAGMLGFGTLEFCLARHWKIWGNVVFGWFVLWLLFLTGSSSSPMKGWIEFLCSVDDASSVWCSYLS